MKLGEKEALEILWQRYRKNGSKEVRDELIVQYLFLVKFVVSRTASLLPSHVKLDDLYSSGVTGLIRAVERFDPTKNTKFESWAILLIRGAIIDELRRLDWIPRSVHQKAQGVAKASQELASTLGREPTDSELSSHLGLSIEEFNSLLTQIRPAILIPLNGNSIFEEESLPMSDRIADREAQTSLEVAHQKECSAFLEKAISELPDQERKVLMFYYFDELRLKEIGEAIGVSESRVSQIHTKAILRLRAKLKAFKEAFSKG